MLFLLWTLLACAVLLRTAESLPPHWQMVDMTHTFDDNSLSWPKLKKFHMETTINGTMEEGYWLQMEEYSSSTHVGTHMDAPCHFSPGKWCADQIPLERLHGPAAVMDITEKAEADPDATVGVEDLRQWEALSGRKLDGHIVVMRSGWGRRYKDRSRYIGTDDDDDQKMHYPGISNEAAQWLVDNREVYGLLSESLSLDHGQEKEFTAQRILLAANIYGVENVANVEEIPIVGAHLTLLPMKMRNSGAAPTRVVAKFPKVTFKQRGVTERSLREVIIFS